MTLAAAAAAAAEVVSIFTIPLFSHCSFTPYVEVEKP
jgi:hypothetical protein